MKKILLILAICVFSAPAFASCSIDSNKPCTANNNIIEYEFGLQRGDPNPFDNTSKKYEIKDFEKNSRAGSQTGLASPMQSGVQNYNANCQFGVCLPGKKPDSIKK